jgi:hypothetical protein
MLLKQRPRSIGVGADSLVNVKVSLRPQPIALARA